MFKSKQALSMLLAGVLFSAGSFANTNEASNWSIDNTHSQVNFISTKKDHVAEVHSFEKISGTFSKQGEFSLSIDLSSVETGISKRDKRLKKHVFNIEKFANATLTSTVDANDVATLAVGDTMLKKVSGILSLAGEQQKIRFEVSITKLSSDVLLVNSSQPIIIRAAKFDLIDGINKLAQLAKLNRISYSVPVTFSLRLTSQ